MTEKTFKNLTHEVMGEIKQEATKSTSKNNPTFRLVAYFKPGSKHPKWMWNSEWLLTYYRTYYGFNQGTEFGAVKMKIQEIINATTRIVVYDNRAGKVPVLLEYVNGKLRVDNTQR
jgi:hypothetical protein